MPYDAFTAGVKPGGLNSTTEIRILLCYLLHSVPQPLTMDEIQQALVGEELVNYFELVSSLSGLCDHGFAKLVEDRYVLQPSGEEIAATLSDDVPFTVRESAVRAAIRAQQYAHKAARHKVYVEKSASGYVVHCGMEDMGVEVFRFSLLLPDERSADLVKQQFIERGDTLYTLMLAGATGSGQLMEQALDALQKDEAAL